MRSVTFAAAAAVLATAALALPAQAAHYRHHSAAPLVGNGGFGTGPYVQGEPTDHRAIWRNGYYQGNDPDQGIRFDLMRDGRNYAH
jgi:hypothetical protein